jgi:hypothetical protein
MPEGSILGVFGLEPLNKGSVEIWTDLTANAANDINIQYISIRFMVLFPGHDTTSVSDVTGIRGEEVAGERPWAVHICPHLDI